MTPMELRELVHVVEGVKLNVQSARTHCGRVNWIGDAFLRDAEAKIKDVRDRLLRAQFDAFEEPKGAYIVGDYRYVLWRDTGSGTGTVVFVMLNPSKANAEDDDPTVRRCVRFARDWGYARVIIVNMYALISTDPKVLLTHPDPVGPDNDAWIFRTVRRADLTVCAWGDSPKTKTRATDVLKLLADAEVATMCLGVTKSGSPKHPVRLAAATEPQAYGVSP